MREAVRVCSGVRGLETKDRDGRLKGFWGGCGRTKRGFGRRVEQEGRRRGSLSLGVAFMVDLVYRFLAGIFFFFFSFFFFLFSSSLIIGAVSRH